MTDPERGYVLRVARGEMEPTEVEGPPTLGELQSWVGGYVESVPVSAPEGWEVVALVDEEGRLKDRPPNVLLPGVGVIRGPLVLVGLDRARGEHLPLPLEVIERYALVRRMDAQGPPELMLTD